ncbi:MAG: heavy metal translocating P-type ATPase metal-binding domain-containing protein [Opitutaceae bacterium]|nr:heavy metal translocating P-type ATPase metal-binding domain-containing protein [Opitutaceae bacterium]
MSAPADKVPAATSPPACAHCGAPLVTEAAREAGFCCAGCAYVNRLVREHGLEGYYRIKDAVIPPVDQAVFLPRDHAWLADLQQHAERAPGPAPRLELDVQGISCAGCVWLIERIFLRQPGALDIVVDAQLGRVRLRWERGRFDAPAFARTLHSFNYLLGPPGEEPAVSESRLLARRIGLCTAFAMNAMLFTLPVYFGMDDTFAYARLFGTLAFVFATLSLLVGGTFFIGRAAQALRDCVLHIDLPIAVGILGAYAGSAFGWLTGAAEFVYFDFVTIFILLMLVGRWAQVAAVERNRRQLLSRQARPAKVRVAGATGEQPVETLAPGDVYEVLPGQVVPVESQLATPAATLGTAWITGEAEPHTWRAGQRVPSGAVNLGRMEIRLRAGQTWRDSLLARLLQPAGRDAYRHRLLERIVAGYLLGIFALAGAAGVGWWLATHDAARTWAVVTAVLVVSCPCAIGLAFPLADEMAAVALRRFGVFVRESDLWPRLARVRRLVFDKTGTLTLEVPALQNPETLAALDAGARTVLTELVRDNPHPVSQCLYENLLVRGLAPGETGAARAAPAGEFREEPGQGVTLRTERGFWSLGRPGWLGAAAAPAGSPPSLAEDGHDAEFARDGTVLARFHFADAVRPDARTEIAALRAEGMMVNILSGDRREKVEAMAETLGLPATQALAGVTPEEKADWLRRHDARDTLMLGDGVNDSLAFDAAFCRGTPVIHRGALEAKADFYYLGRGLAGLRRLFAVNRSRRRTQQWLLVFSVAYNTVAVGLAVAGHMSPLLAVVLMPASSLASLGITIGGMRSWLKL